MKIRTTLIATTLLASVMASTLAVAGVTPLNANGSKRRVSATVNTTTKVVSEPIVEKKIEASQTWVPELVEASTATATMYIEEPIKPIIPIIAALTSLDCNNNGIADTTEISAGAIDFDGDSVLDSCETRLGDLNLNGTIDQQDVSILVGWWGIPNPLYGDLNFDGVVDANDLGILLGRFGAVTY